MMDNLTIMFKIMKQVRTTAEIILKRNYVTILPKMLWHLQMKEGLTILPRMMKQVLAGTDD